MTKSIAERPAFTSMLGKRLAVGALVGGLAVGAVWVEGGSLNAAMSATGTPTAASSQVVEADVVTVGRVVKRHWGRGKGEFRTRGRYGAATVRG